jgi:hypothetical protein
MVAVGGIADPEWQAWRSRSLAEEDIAQLILYQCGVSATIDGQRTEIVLNVVIGVHPDGTRTVLEIQSAPRRWGDHSSIAGLWEGMTGRAFQLPEQYTIGSSGRLRRSVLDENLGWKPTLSCRDDLAMNVWQLIRSGAIDLEQRPDRADEV